MSQGKRNSGEFIRAVKSVLFNIVEEKTNEDIANDITDQFARFLTDNYQGDQVYISPDYQERDNNLYLDYLGGKSYLEIKDKYGFKSIVGVRNLINKIKHQKQKENQLKLL